jgi:thiol-disulfide isomerase/thioredoxin
MKLPSLLCAGLSLAVAAIAAEPTPNTTPDTPANADAPAKADGSAAAGAASAASEAYAKIQAEVNPVIDQIRTKVGAGKSTEADFAEELQALDKIVAAHAAEKSDPVAQVALTKGMFYVQYLKNFDKGRQIIADVQKNFPNTKSAEIAGQIEQHLDAYKAQYEKEQSLAPGSVFPDFDEKDIAGQPLSIAKYKGKVVLVDFWATWCGPCVNELPNVKAAYEKYHDKGFEIVGISLDQNEEKLKSFLAEKKIAWPQYFDGQGWDSKLGRRYGVDTIPATYLLDGEGKIVAKNLRGEALSREVARLLKQP